MFSTAIIFDRRGKADDGKEGALEVRVTIDRKSYYINTGVRVLRKHWAGAVVARPDADALNNRLGIVVRRVNEKMNEFIEQRKPIDVEVIKNYIYDGTTVDVKTDRFLEWLEKAIPLMQIKDDTRQHYWLLLDRLRQYGKMRSWSDLTVDAIYDWNAWLRQTLRAYTKKGEPERGASEGTLANYHKKLKAVLNMAKDFGLIANSPYERLRGKFKRPNNENFEYLTEEQMQVILNTHPVVGSQMEAARDLFVFQMFTGLSYSDAQAFDIKDYRRESVDGIDGEKTVQWTHTGKRIKTGVPYVSVLLPPVVDVLERHGWRVPQMSNQKYNWLLKTLGTVIGIEGLHSHLARHTFGTYMIANDTKVQNLMRMMGHKNIRQTMMYAKVQAKDVRAEYGNVARKLK